MGMAPMIARAGPPAYDCNHMGNEAARIAGVSPRRQRVAAGEALFRQGDPTFGFFRLVSGAIRMLRVTPAGEQVAMHSVRPGELFAEASLFSPRYHCDALAARASEVLVYPKRELLRRLKDHPEDAWRFAGDLAHRVQQLRTRLEVRQIRSAPQRVLQALRLRCGDGGAWRIEGTLKQLAEEVGLTHEALYRALARLEREGRIRRGEGEIRLTARR